MYMIGRIENLKILCKRIFNLFLLQIYVITFKLNTKKMWDKEGIIVLFYLIIFYYYEKE